jgi:hypothetical protein
MWLVSLLGWIGSFISAVTLSAWRETKDVTAAEIVRMTHDMRAAQD